MRWDTGNGGERCFHRQEARMNQGPQRARPEACRGRRTTIPIFQHTGAPADGSSGFFFLIFS